MAERIVILDTETTGLDPKAGHRLIEVGCVEVKDRKPTEHHFHAYFNPERHVPAAAIEIHGITDDFLQDKPYFRDVAEAFMAYIKGATLVIHNAAFDVGFLNHELSLLAGNTWGEVTQHCEVFDTLSFARKRHPGQRNSLDALCKRYGVDNQARTLHGALLDAQLLAEVYLAMTGGQTSFFGEEDPRISAAQAQEKTDKAVSVKTIELPVIKADAKALAAHEAFVEMMQS